MDKTRVKVTDNKIGAVKNLNSMPPLNWLLKIFAINCNLNQKSNSRTTKILAGTLLGILNLFTVYYKIFYLFEHNGINKSIEFTDTVMSIFNHCQYIVDLVLVHKFGSDISRQYCKQYANIDKIIGMNNSYYKIINNRLFKLVIAFLLIWSLTTVLDYVAWAIVYGWVIPIFFLLFNLYLLIKIITNLDLTAHILNVEYRLRVMGDIIQYYYTTSEPLPGEWVSNVVDSNTWFYKNCGDTKFHFNISKQKFSLYHELRILCRCYLLLTEQVMFINNIFGLRIVLNSLTLLVDMIRIANITLRIAFNAFGYGSIQDISFYLLLTSNASRTIFCALVLFSLMYHSEQAYRQSDRILKVIDHLLINKNPKDSLRTAATEFRDLLQSRPIRFIMGEDFTLNYSAMVSFASVFVTYTIILFEM